MKIFKPYNSCGKTKLNIIEDTVARHIARLDVVFDELEEIPRDRLQSLCYADILVGVAAFLRQVVGGRVGPT